LTLPDHTPAGEARPNDGVSARTTSQGRACPATVLPLAASQAAIAPGWRRAPSQAAAICALQEHPLVLGQRRPAYKNTMKVAWALVCPADWRTMTAWPGWDTLMAVTGLSRSVVAARLQLFRSIGWLGTVERGSTPQFRPGVMHGLPDRPEGNRRAVYVICVPDPAAAAGPGCSPVDLPRTPTSTSLSTPNTSGRNARETPKTHATSARPAASPNAKSPAAGTKSELTRAVRELRRRSLVLRRLSEPHVRHLVRPYLAAGWTVSDLLYALDHTPSGDPWTFAGQVRSPAAWARFRWSWWLADGRPVPPRSAQLRARATQQRAEQLAARRAAEQLRNGRSDAPPSGLIAGVRTQLASVLEGRPGAAARAVAQRRRVSGRLRLTSRPAPGAGDNERPQP
jgi:hypothetical protein